MEKELYICDECGRETKDYYNEKGWIVFRDLHITFTKGRRKDKTAKTGFYSKFNNGNHFCSLSCFKNFLIKLP